LIIITLMGPDVLDDIQVATSHNEDMAKELVVDLAKEFIPILERYQFLDFQILKQLEHIDSFVIDLWDLNGSIGRRCYRIT